MDHKRLKEILIAFADDPTTLFFEKNEIIVQIQQEVISARLQQDGGILFVEENNTVLPAAQWVGSRIAQLDQLAHNVTQMFPSNAHFIDAPARLLDQLSNTDSNQPRDVSKSLEALQEVLGRRPAGMCSVQYLTSDAGEGKTTLINQLALVQAAEFRQRRSKWLLVPIALGGNPFLRLDNIIAAGLLNQIRVRRFFYEAFIELIRLGFIVLALDGFEEIFVETAGDAVSSLGNLIRDLQGEGTVLIAARTAYFDFKRLDQQAQLYDSLPDYEVGFSKLELCRWSERQFLEMCQASGLTNGQSVYLKLRQVLPEDHPLLTRAVFVRRIIDLAKDDSLGFVDHAANVNDLFYPFIDSILEREIRYKWIDSSTGVATPLLTLEEHHDLLGLIAEEMLLSKRAALPINAIQDYADLFCEVRQKPPMVARQVRERITNHALLAIDATKTQVTFDHDHFREFFLGELLSRYLIDESDINLRKILRVEPLAPFSLDTAISICLTRGMEAPKLNAVIHDAAISEGSSSFVRENCGGLTTRVLNRYEDHSGSLIADLTFPANALARRLRGVHFENCYFQSTGLHSDMADIVFEKCDFEWIELERHVAVHEVKMKECRIQAVSLIKPNESSRDFFEPQAISSLLISCGIDIGQTQPQAITDRILEEDPEVSYVRKLLTVFARSTVVSDHLLTMKFGSSFRDFESRVMPQLIHAKIVFEVPNRGGGSQRRFKLARPVSQLVEILATAEGSFDRFLSLE